MDLIAEASKSLEQARASRGIDNPLDAGLVVPDAGGLSNAAKHPGDADAMNQLAGAEGALTGAMGRLFAVMEAYPDLKANQNMMALQEEITSTENKVAFSRQAFNDAVTSYNTYRQSFPPVIVAPLFGHATNASLLEFADSAQIQDAPKVSFN
jgi:LemA protein